LSFYCFIIRWTILFSRTFIIWFNTRNESTISSWWLC
jgi:hypothetical protein